MNTKMFKEKICSYCKHEKYCSKDTIEYINEEEIKTVKCKFYCQKRGDKND